jgi:hypothetical protein
MIISLIGEKRSGKNTVGKILIDNYKFTPLAFADKIKEVAELLFGWTPEFMESYKEDIDPKWGISPRNFFTFFGMNCMQLFMSDAYPNFKEKVGRGFWAMETLERMKKLKEGGVEDFVITDMRFIHEQKLLERYAYEENEVIKFIKVRRSNHRNEYDDNDLTEKEVDHIRYDFLIESDNLEDLNFKTNSLLKELLNNKEELKNINNH